MPIVDAAHLNGVLRGLRQSHSRAAALPRDALVGNSVLPRTPTEFLGGEFTQPFLAFLGYCVGRARHGVSGGTSALNACPGQILRGIAPADVYFLPGHSQ